MNNSAEPTTQMHPTTPIIVWSMQPVWGMPSASPFGVKLETWLRIAGLDYETRVLMGPPKSSTGKFPYIERPGGRVLADSSTIIETLTEERDVQIDAGLTSTQRGLARAIQRMLEEHFYFTMLWSRWWPDESWAIVAPAYFSNLPAPVRALGPPLLRRGIKKALVGQGMGRLTAAEIRARAGQDLAALSQLLDDQPYMLGDDVHGVDATVYAMVAGTLDAPVAEEMQRLAFRHANLVAYVARMKARYWPAYG